MAVPPEARGRAAELRTQRSPPKPKRDLVARWTFIVLVISAVAFLFLVAGLGRTSSIDWAYITSHAHPPSTLPPQALIINQKSFNMMETVLPPTQLNASSVRHHLPIERNRITFCNLPKGC